MNATTHNGSAVSETKSRDFPPLILTTVACTVYASSVLAFVRTGRTSLARMCPRREGKTVRVAFELERSRHTVVDTNKHTSEPKAASGDKHRVAACKLQADKATANCNRRPIKPPGRSLFIKGPRTDSGEQRARASSFTITAQAVGSQPCNPRLLFQAGRASPHTPTCAIAVSQGVKT